MGRESSPAEAGLPSLEDPASAIWAIDGRATNAIPAPMSPIGLEDPGDDAGPDPTPVAAVRLATAGPRAAADARSLIRASCARRGRTPSLTVFPRERARCAHSLGAPCRARSPEVSICLPRARDAGRPSCARLL